MPPADRSLESVEMLDGRRYQGFIESQDEAWLNLIQIQRPSGQPMYLVIRPIERSAIAAVVRLDDPQRARLRQQIEQFVNRARIEAGRMEGVRLTSVTRNDLHFQRYRGKWFTLDSTADEPTTRRIIVRLEQVFTAYRQILAPRTEPQRPVQMVVLGSMAEYRTHLARLGLSLQNPACFIAEENLVVAGSDVRQVGAALAKVRTQHDQLQDELDLLLKEMPLRLADLARQMQADGLPSDQVTRALLNKRREFEAGIKKKRNDVQAANRENDRIFQSATNQMFTRLYHEAFHAYLENYVYPHETHAVPVWLNEGLAQVCEAGLLESDTLRIDAPNREALKRLQADLRGKQPLSLEGVLAAGPGDFLSGEQSNRLYVYSWGLAYYLTFEKRLLGSPALDQYVAVSVKTMAPGERFEKLVGAPLAKFEPDWREYCLGLRQP